MLAVMKPISPGPSRSISRGLGGEDADAVDLVRGAGAHHPDLLAFDDLTIPDPQQDHDAEIGVVPAVDQQRLERGFGIAPGRRQTLHDRLQDLVDPLPGLGRDQERVVRVQADDVLDLLLDPLGLGCRQVDLVEHRDDLVVGVDRLVGVGKRLGLDPLGRVDQQNRALAGAQGPADLVGEVDVPRRVDQVQLIALTVAGGVGETHGLRLDGDAALALELHGVEHLARHLARLEPAAALDDPVGQRRLAVIDVGNDREIADAGEVGHRRSGFTSGGCATSSGPRRRLPHSGHGQAASNASLLRQYLPNPPLPTAGFTDLSRFSADNIRELSLP